MTDVLSPLDDRAIAASATSTPAFSGLDLLREDFARRSAAAVSQAVPNDAPPQTAQPGAAPRPEATPQPEAAPRVYTIRPTDLIPHQVLDIEATFNAQIGVRRAIRNLPPTASAGISPDIMPAETVRSLASQMHRVADRLTPGQQPISMTAGLEPFANHAARVSADPARQRLEVGVQLELMRRSLNQELEAMGSAIRFGPMQLAVDEGGRQFHALPVLHNGVHTNMLRFPPLLSESEIRDQIANRPRLV